MEPSVSSSDLRESIVTPAETVNKFVLISDLHFGDLPQVAVDEFIDYVDTTRPTAVICSGDITLYSEAAEFALVSAFFTKLDQLHVPIIFTCGNHDMGGKLSEKLSTIVGVKNFASGYASAVNELQNLFTQFIVGRPHTVASNIQQLDAVCRFGSEIFVLLRSQHRKIERIKSEQLRWCQNVLDNIVDLSTCRLHLVAHHSLWQDEGGDKHTPLDRRRRLEADLLGRYQFSTYIHGHNHRFTYQNTTTPKTGLRIRRIAVPTMCTRNRSYERGFVCWKPSGTTMEPELRVLKWQLSAQNAAYASEDETAVSSSSEGDDDSEDRLSE